MSKIQRRDCWLLFTLWSNASSMRYNFLPYYLENGSIGELFLSSCPAVKETQSLNHSSCEDFRLRAPEMEQSILILSACTPELWYGGMFDAETLAPGQVQFKQPFNLLSLGRSECYVYLFVSACLFIGLCVRLWRGDFGQWLWATADHPWCQTWQHPGRLCWLLTAGWTGKTALSSWSSGWIENLNVPEITPSFCWVQMAVWMNNAPYLYPVPNPVLWFDGDSVAKIGDQYEKFRAICCFWTVHFSFNLLHSM